MQTRSQVHQHLGLRLECHLLLTSGLPESLKGLNHQVLLTQPSTRNLSAWMLMQPGQHGLLQTLLEYCPGFLISVCNRATQDFQAIHLKRLVSIPLLLMLLVFQLMQHPFYRMIMGLFIRTIIPL